MNKETIIKTFGNKLRLRVSGICVEDDKVLVIKHRSLGEKGYLWSPPGGGLKYGENIETALKREFLEETGLQIEVKNFMFVNEFFELPLHAVELFFEVKITGGKLTKGLDPEMPESEQIIDQLEFLPFSKIKEEGKGAHSLFTRCNNLNELLNLKGFF